MKKRLAGWRRRLVDVYEKIDRTWFEHLRKLRHRLTHNRVIFIRPTKLVLCNRLAIPLTNKKRRSITGYAFIMLWIVWFAIFALYPLFNTLYLSFFKVRMDGALLDLEFVGIANYQAVFLSDPYFVEILVGYILETLINVPVVITFALLIALLINQNVKGKGLWRTIFFLPVVITSGPVIAELMDQGATTLPALSDYRFVDVVVGNVGGFLATPLQALFDQILLILWFAGIQILIFLAGLQKIDKEIYEASKIDGAGPWASFWKITLPSLMPLIMVAVVYTVVSMSVFSLNEVIVYIRNIMLGESTPALTTGYGYSATLAWVFFIVMSLIILLFLGLLRIRKGRERA